MTCLIPGAGIHATMLKEASQLWKRSSSASAAVAVVLAAELSVLFMLIRDGLFRRVAMPQLSMKLKKLLLCRNLKVISTMLVVLLPISAILLVRNNLSLESAKTGSVYFRNLAPTWMLITAIISTYCK